ncbi:zeta toxin family protein [Micromonospora sp. DT81.3]|uniref:zeta toxin family protein n=1 Tax=Micromonospora sp. DT81.3 TaxID=3416523 RepID=UPI003CF89734
MPSDEELRRIFEQQILPIVFPAASSSAAPTLVLLAGQPGAGRSRATAGVLAESPADMVVLSGDDLRVFHPHFLALNRSRLAEAPQILAEASAAWVRSCLRHARTAGRSLLVDGPFHTPRVALATADLFARDGFTTRVVVAATPRAESLLATASRYLLDARAGRASRFTSVEDHDGDWNSTRALVGELETTPSVDRLTVIGREGAARFDAERTAPERFTGATRALVREQATSMTSGFAMRWMSELRAMTDYVMASPQAPRPLGELLIELHEVALNEVLPRLSLPLDSLARPAAEASLAEQLIELRRAVPVEPANREDVAAPVSSPAQPDRGISR